MIKYIPLNALWLNRLFIELANRNDRLCLTIDCSEINKDSPGRFQTEADNSELQTCYLIQQTTKRFITSLSAKE